MNTVPLILRVALPTPLRRFFDYLAPQVIDLDKIKPGIRIKVPFQSREMIGILVATSSHSDVPANKLKKALAILDEKPVFTPDLYQLCEWAANYYHHALGDVFASALPQMLRKNKLPRRKKLSTSPENCEAFLTLNSEQAEAVQKILAAKNTFKPFLLHGITGSGKTEIYLNIIQQLMEDQKQILLLVPEISLTPQMIARFGARFNTHIATLHSHLTESERMQAWMDAKSGDCKIIIGTRSAIFTPFANLGAIIVDEEHDSSFKQQDKFRYHARDLAVMRAHILQIPIILGSATPSLESMENVVRNRYEYLFLSERAGDAILPQCRLIDLRQTKLDNGLSQPLIEAIREHLAANQQVMLFLNRRGFAPVLYCTECAFMPDCKRCAARLVYHRTPLRLQCHHCDAQQKIPAACPQCGNTDLRPVGVGTQRLEQVLQELFPEVPLIRVDRDNTERKGKMQQLLEKVHTTDKAILLGTQMLAKGHHFPRVTLVGILDADGGLFSADFRAAEQMSQLLLQVAGRAGRAEKKGMVLIQTHHPEHPLLQTLLTQNYQTIANMLLNERKTAVLPPYSHFILFRAHAYNEKNAQAFLTAIKSFAITQTLNLLGPVAALLPKRKGLFCQHLLLQAGKRNELHEWIQNNIHTIDKLATEHSVKWTLDVDPVSVI